MLLQQQQKQKQQQQELNKERVSYNFLSQNIINLNESRPHKP